MDTSELMRLGANAVIAKLCNDIAEITRAVPETRGGATKLLRQALGYKATGAAARMNGTRAAKLASDLVMARQTRGSGAWTPERRAKMSRLAKQRAAKAKRLGLPIDRLPSKDVLAKAEAKAASAKA